MIDNSAGQTILEAYRNSQNAQYQQDQLAQQKEIADENLEMRRQELDETRDYHQSALDYAHAKAKMDIQDALNEHYGNTASTPTQNLPQPDPQTSFIPGQNPGGAPGFGVSDPGASTNLSQPYQMKFAPDDVLSKVFGSQGATIDPMFQAKQFLLQKRLADLKAYEAGSTESQKDAAKEPYEVKADERKYASAANVANIIARSRVQAAKYHSLNQELDPDAIDEGIQDVYGGGDITKYTGKLRNAIAGGVGAIGGTVGDGKSINKTLDNAPAIDQIFNQATDFAKNYSVDAPGGSNTGKILGGWAATAIPGTTLAGNVNALKDKVGVLASNLDQNNRKNEAEIVRQQIGNGVDPKQTTQQNLENIQKGRALYAKFLQGAFHNLPQPQIDHILKTNNLGDYASDGKFGGVGTQAKSSGFVKVTDKAGNSRVMPEAQAKVYTDQGFTATPVQ